MRHAFHGALSRVFTLAFLAVAIFLVPLAALAQDVPAATSTLAIGIPWLDTTLKILAMVGVLASIVSHFVSPTSGFGKVVSWLALNFGKALTTPKPATVTELPPRGFARFGTLVAIVVVASCLTACAFMTKTFGPKFAADELNCETSEIAPLRDALVPQAQAAIVKAIASAVSGDVGAAVTVGLAFLESAVKTALGDQWAAVLCAEQVAVSDYEKAHASDAGPVVTGLTFDRPDPAAQAYAAVKAHLAAQPKRPKAQ